MTSEPDRLKAALADRYTIERELGAGGMATVYLAEDLKHHRKVAIKVLRPELAAALGTERFFREIEITANLNHPHILPLLDSGTAEEQPSARPPDRPSAFLYYVMPYVEGESLRERLDHEGKVPIAEMVRLTDEIASALSYAHDQGIVHRDIKPENVMLSGGRAVVADFGIARAVSAAGGTKLTGTGFAVGTPAYMSPEQAYGDANIDGRSDVYALGCVAYEMVSGRAPFEADTPQALLAKHAADTVPSMRASDSSIPLFVERAVECALAKQPADRFQTASAFAEALTSEMVVARVGKRRWTRPAVVAPAIGVALAAAVWAYITLLGGPAYERLAVLPPTNLMNDPEQDYLVQGVHEALITELQSAGVSVIARTSVVRYRDTDKSISEIAGELDVDALIEASVLRSRDSVELVVRIVDGVTEEYVSEPMVRSGELRNVLALYRNLTSAIAAEIRVALTPQAEARLATARSIDPAAYEAYLKGTQARRSLTPGGFETAERYFNLALQIDPEYAAAWAGISRVWGARGQMGIMPQKEAMERAKEALAEALALDETDWDAHRALVGILTWQDWDWPAAEREWNRVLEGNPNDGNALATYSHFLMILGRPEEAMEAAERSLRLDPFDVAIQSFYAVDLVFARRYDEAIAAARATLRLQTDAPVAAFGLYCALFMQGMLEEALALDREILGGDRELLDALERGYSEAGYGGAQLRIAEVMAGRFLESGVPAASAVANKYLYAGDRDQTLEWLERAYQDGDRGMPYLGLPIYDSIRSDSRYHDLRRRMGLPE